MFTILLIIGSFFIVVGIGKNKKQSTHSTLDTESKPISSVEFHELRARIDHIESTLFYDIPQLPEQEAEIEKVSTLDSIDDSITYESVAKLVTSHLQQDESNTSNSTKDKFTLLCQYEKENYGIEQICVLLNMNKGEVLLLKNLYRTSLV